MLGDVHDYLRHSRGVIHVGANVGQERDEYAKLDLPVVWIEPIPSVSATLRANIASFPTQRALECLVSDTDGTPVTFHVASNNGESSSMLELKGHKDLWPDIDFASSLELTTVTLPTALARAGIEPAHYDALVLDTQGAELLVLRGTTPILPGFRTIFAEAADFALYEGCATVAQLETFLGPHGFVLSRRELFFGDGPGKSVYDLLFTRK